MEFIAEQAVEVSARNAFYNIVANAAKMKLIESIVDFGLFELFQHKAYVTENFIIKTFGLKPIRAKKWLHLLCSQSFLSKVTIDHEVRYSLGEFGKHLMGADQAQWWSFKRLVASWQVVASENLYNVLRHGAVKVDAPWPPQTPGDVEFLEEWMTHTISPPLAALHRYIDFNRVSNLLDVGGGDGSISCQLAKVYPHLKATVYNLPQTIPLVNKTIDQYQLADRVSSYSGDFMQEASLPNGFDLILFNRVLWDWSSATNIKLLNMAYHALAPGHSVAICEAFKESNALFALAWEFRYIFWDDFEVAVFKTSEQYKTMLRDIGFEVLPNQAAAETANFSVILAKKSGY